MKSKISLGGASSDKPMDINRLSLAVVDDDDDVMIVWQMSMPLDLSLPIQRAVRTMLSGVMLVQCFTLYIYLASYIVLLYPVFLEDRPALVLPWLLLAAIRRLLCELTSLALGLGICILLGPARPSCIKFLIIKVISIIPVLYSWILVLSYYHALKLSTAFKTFPAIVPPNDHDFGLELAIRRRKTKSLFGEDQLRTKLISNLYGERQPSSSTSHMPMKPKFNEKMDAGRLVHDNAEYIDKNLENFSSPLLATSDRIMTDTGSIEDCLGTEVVVPRDTDRIMEQIILMLLQVAAYVNKEGSDSVKFSYLISSPKQSNQMDFNNENTDGSLPGLNSNSAKLDSFSTNGLQKCIIKSTVSQKSIKKGEDKETEVDLNINKVDSFTLCESHTLESEKELIQNCTINSTSTIELKRNNESDEMSVENINRTKQNDNINQNNKDQT